MPYYTNTRAAADLTPGNVDELRFFGAKTGHVNMFNRAKELLGTPDLPETLPYLGTNMGAYKDGTDRAHFGAGTPHGRLRYAKIWMFQALAHFNMATWRMPCTLDSRYNAPDGSYADFWMSDGDISTYRIVNGLPPWEQIGTIGPKGTGAQTPHRTEVFGWSVNGSPAAQADLYTVTAADVTNGHTAPEGKQVCRVYMPDGHVLTWRDNITYLPNGTIDPWVFEDAGDQSPETYFTMNTLVANIGQPATMAWMQVQPTDLAPPPIGYAVPDLFRARGVGIRSKDNNLVTRVSADTMHFEISFRPQGHSPNFQGIFSLGTGLRCYWRADGTIRIDMTGTEGSAVIDTPAPDYTPFHPFQVLQFTFDRTGDRPVRILDDAGNVIASGNMPGEVSFFGQLRVFKDSNSTFDELDAMVEYARLRIGATTRAGTVSYAFEGDSAAAATTFSTGGVAVTGGSDFRLTGSSGLLTPATL